MLLFKVKFLVFKRRGISSDPKPLINEENIFVFFILLCGRPQIEKLVSEGKKLAKKKRNDEAIGLFAKKVEICSGVELLTISLPSLEALGDHLRTLGVNFPFD